MTKWECCLLRGADGVGTFNPVLYRTTANGVELVTNFKDRPKGISEAQAVAQIISKLGEDGWEMISDETSVATEHAKIWFKRPRP